MRAIEFNGDFNGFLSRFNFQPELTRKLDNMGDSDFNQHLINEIVLWKVNRYALLDPELLAELDLLRELKAGEH